jgi:aminocarboxymuconate-semialdehyde decarboxylase
MNEPLVDTHAHVVLEATFGAAGQHGPELVSGDAPRYRTGGYELHGVRYRQSPFMDVQLRLERMDKAGIDEQVLSPNPLTFFHHIEPDVAVDFCRRHNDALAELVGAHDRLHGMAALPFQDIGASVVELERCVTELGLIGAYVGTDAADRQLDDPAFDDLYTACVELDVPLFLHPTPDGIDTPVKDPRLSRWDLELVIGFAYDETITVATLIYGGVLERHPQLDVCISHGGGATPYLYARMAKAARLRPWAAEWLRQPGAFDRSLRRIWFDSHVGDVRSLSFLAESVGAERLVFGTNFAGWDQVGDVELGPLDADIRRASRELMRLRRG